MSEKVDFEYGEMTGTITLPGPIALVFYGKVPAKKNSLIPVAGKQIINTKARAAIQRLEIQVPGWARDMKLLHPDIEFEFSMPEGRSDRDNMLTTLLDVLCNMGVLANDTVAKCNGTIILRPAKYAPEYITTVTIRPNKDNGWKIPRKKRRGLQSP